LPLDLALISRKPVLGKPDSGMDTHGFEHTRINNSVKCATAIVHEMKLSDIGFDFPVRDI
jgi:hypothetical protein